eukprot:705660-Pyramimonas_sp.AAC.1
MSLAYTIENGYGNCPPHLYLRGAGLVTLQHVVNARSTDVIATFRDCLLYTSPSPRDRSLS